MDNGKYGFKLLKKLPIKFHFGRSVSCLLAILESWLKYNYRRYMQVIGFVRGFRCVVISAFNHLSRIYRED